MNKVCEGSEVYLKPIGDHVKTGEPITYYTVVEAAKRRGETAIGYRIMGESHDARAELGDWADPGFDAGNWEAAILARDQPRVEAVFSDTAGNREVDLGFVRPGRLQAYSAPAIRVTQELPAKRVTEPKPVEP